MNTDYNEEPRVLNCEGDQILGVYCEPLTQRHEIAVLIVVGGPQYRAGSHRQFTLLARALARCGFASLRFDYRGMGDSDGDFRNFEAVDADIRVAVNDLSQRSSAAKGIVIWALCDAASAALFYAPTDPRISGLILLNPWVHSAATGAAAQLRHYYIKRLLQPAFWRKLWSGQFNLARSARDLRATAHSALASEATSNVAQNPRHGSAGYIERMLRGYAEFKRPIQLILSGNDLTAREFIELQRRDQRWRRATRRSAVTQTTLTDANHTFASAAWRHKVEEISARWLAQLDAVQPLR